MTELSHEYSDELLGDSRKPRVLIVDDEKLLRDAVVDMVEAFGYEPETAEDGIAALNKIELDIDLVLLDLVMPRMDGFEVARRIRENPRTRDIPIIMVTGMDSRTERLRAVESGVNDFIAKPVDITELRVRTQSLLRMKAAQDALKRHHAQLEDAVNRRTESLRQAVEEVTRAQREAIEAQLETIHCLAMAAEFKDEDTAHHVRRMSQYCSVLARAHGMAPGDVERILHASPMHDVGKIGVPDAILLKPGRLADEEMEIMRQHTIFGGQILGSSQSALLQMGRVIALTHHEKWDGTGYPNGVVGEDIPLVGRICAVADVFDALTSERPYKKAFPNEKAYDIVREGRGKHFDPDMVDAFFDNLSEIEEIQAANQDPHGGAGTDIMSRID